MMSHIGGWKRYDGSSSGKLSFGLYGSQLAFVRIELSPSQYTTTHCPHPPGGA